MLAGESPTFSTVAGMLIIVSSLVIYFKGAEIVKHIRSAQRTQYDNNHS
jgi:type IV secretory pathway VirB2 component (pilin)